MPLSSMTKRKTRAIQAELKTDTNVLSYNIESNFEKAPPVVNIHVHVPPKTNPSIESNQVHPTIHLHFGGQINLSSSSTSENIKMIETISRNNLTPEVICTSKKQSNSNEETVVKPFKKNKIHKKLHLSKVNENCKNLRTDKSELVLNSDDICKENTECQKNIGCKRQLPLRRSIRQANNRKLLESLEEIKVKKSITKKTKNKELYKELNIETKSGFLGNEISLKEPVVILHDIKKILKKKNITFSDAMIGDKEKGCLDFINLSAEEIDSLEKCQKLPYGSLDESENTQNLVELINEGDKVNLTKSSNDPKVISVNAKCADVSPLEYESRGNKATGANNDVINFEDESTFRNNLQSTEEDSEEKNFYKNLFDIRSTYVEVCSNSQFNNIELLQSQEHKNTTLMENNLSKFVFKSVDQTFNEFSNSSNESDHRHGVQDLNPDYDLSHLNFEIDSCESASVKGTNMGRVHVSVKSNNNNMLKNIIEENKMLLTEKDDNWGINVHTPNFQLELIKKEMKKRNMIVSRSKAEINRKYLKKKASSQISPKEVLNISSVRNVKPPKKITGNVDLVKNTEKCSSVQNFIPLEVSGPTKFAVGQISKINPYFTHKARSMKNEILFGKRVKRHLDPKQHQINLLKKEAAKKRIK